MNTKHVQRRSKFRFRPIVLMDRYERWRKVARMQKVSREALRRLEWIIYYETKGEFNASHTSRYFGIARKTLYKFLDRFDSSDFHCLEDRSCAPHHVRHKEITLEEEGRVKALRKELIFSGKLKLRAEYQARFNQDISDWKIGYTIKKHQLFPNPSNKERVDKIRMRSRSRKKITDLTHRNKQTLGWLIQIDTIVLHLGGVKRYILTAIDRYGKLAFAHCYKNQSSYSAQDFLQRLNFLLDDQITNLQTDNGSEFLKYFESACQDLNITHFFSRPRTPKDNAVVERFNRTLQEEWLATGQFNPNIDIFNQRLTNWLIFYNFKRRHASLGNISPMDFCVQTGRVLPMSPTRTMS